MGRGRLDRDEEQGEGGNAGEAHEPAAVPILRKMTLLQPWQRRQRGGEPIGWTDTWFIAPPDACKGGGHRRHVVNAGVVGNQGHRQGE